MKLQFNRLNQVKSWRFVALGCERRFFAEYVIYLDYTGLKARSNQGICVVCMYRC